MPKKVWIKLYLDILNNPNMARLPNWLWRRAIELFLLAGENGDDGYLPSVEEMAWRLRVSEEDLEKSLRAFSDIGVVNQTHDGWMVTHFKERQAMKSTARVRAFRERNASETTGVKKRNGNVTAAASSMKRSGNVSSSSSLFASAASDSDSESNSSSSSSSAVSKPVSEKFPRNKANDLLSNLLTIPGSARTLYQSRIKDLTPVTESMLEELVEKYGNDDVREAIVEGLRRGKTDLNYAAGILRNWYEESQED